MQNGPTTPQWANFSLRSVFVAVAVVAAAVWVYLNIPPFGLLLAIWILVVGLGLIVNVPKSILSLVVTGLFFLSMPGLLLCVAQGHPVSVIKLSQIQDGDSKARVRRILGSPTCKSYGGSEWTYSSWTWCVIQIQFDSDGDVVRIDHDH